jgi:hypothetical protein
MSVDLGIILLQGSFNAIGVSASVEVWGDFNLMLTGSFIGTVEVDRSMDSGANWAVVAADGIGTPASYTHPIGILGLEIEPGVLYRLNCTSFSNGPINYRLSQSPFRPIGT